MQSGFESSILSYDNLDIKAPFVAHLPKLNCRIGISTGSQHHCSIYVFKILQNFDIDFDHRFLKFRTSGAGPGGLPFSKISKTTQFRKYWGNPLTCVGFGWRQLPSSAAWHLQTCNSDWSWNFGIIYIGGLGHPGEHLKRDIIWGNTGAADCMSLVACSCWQLLGA